MRICHLLSFRNFTQTKSPIKKDVHYKKLENSKKIKQRTKKTAQKQHKKPTKRQKKALNSFF